MSTEAGYPKMWVATKWKVEIKKVSAAC